ncbi:MAG TPA: peptidase M14 [Xanthomonadales bacterium]|nr:peptidase M14 [Xanthomonadales bacterium]
MRRLRTRRFTLTAGRVGRLRIALAVLAGLAGCVTPGGVRPQDFPAPVPVPISPPDTPALVIDRTRVGPLALLDQHVLPGSRARLLWRTGQNYFGADLESPVLIVHGARPGPVLCLVAGVHGDEINGVETVRRVLSEARPEALAGTLIGVPVVNLFGYQRGSRYLPDRRDLNRFFPGSRSGSIASRIAHSFFNAVVRQCDALVDFHTGSFDRANLPQVRADLSRAAVRELARGFGPTVVLHSPGSRGMLRNSAVEVGIPAVTFEAGAPTRLQEDEIGTVAAAIERLMAHLGMTAPISPGLTRPDWGSDQPALFYASRWLRAEHGGLLISEVALGEQVEVGQRLGRIIDPLSDRIHEVRSNLAGRMLGMAENQQVLPGFALYHIGLDSDLRSSPDESEPETDAPEENGSDAREREVSIDPEPEDG